MKVEASKKAEQQQAKVKVLAILIQVLVSDHICGGTGNDPGDRAGAVTGDGAQRQADGGVCN